MCICKKEIREEAEEWKWWDERGRKKHGLCRSSNHEKWEGEIVREIEGEISEIVRVGMQKV